MHRRAKAISDAATSRANAAAANAEEKAAFADTAATNADEAAQAANLAARSGTGGTASLRECNRSLFDRNTTVPEATEAANLAASNADTQTQAAKNAADSANQAAQAANTAAAELRRPKQRLLMQLQLWHRPMRNWRQRKRLLRKQRLGMRILLQMLNAAAERAIAAAKACEGIVAGDVAEAVKVALEGIKDQPNGIPGLDENGKLKGYCSKSGIP